MYRIVVVDNGTTQTVYTPTVPGYVVFNPRLTQEINRADTL